MRRRGAADDEHVAADDWRWTTVDTRRIIVSEACTQAVSNTSQHGAQVAMWS
jgi:hypothetical protein